MLTKSGVFTFYDFFTDIIFVIMVYTTFHELRTNECFEGTGDCDDEKNRRGHYIFVCIVSLLSAATPIMYRLSCTLLIMFSQGDFEQTN